MAEESMHQPRHLAATRWVEMAAGLALFVLLVEGLLLGLAAPAGLRLSAGLVFLTMLGLIAWRWPTAWRWLGWANRITLLRGMLVAFLAGALLFPAFMAAQAPVMAALALAALLLDGVDGFVARTTRSMSRFGARFDMELDAFFILVLSAALIALDKAGAWVLVIGVMRYCFVLAGRAWPWLRRPLPDSRRRKLACVWQVATLLVGLLPVVPAWVATGLAALALGLLAYSFGADVAWLRRQWRASHAPAAGDPASRAP
ncbi:CDP-alcohol phosphatidyltransferase family protein [Modicisalibacter radicis]|uniref:CDP-alcohol phosphatidyltransferase family protein n=1 Tax=Halomonas sp. EAR18 TaxID=2518972 RepID=UPI00109CCBB5|nr:CDP-alcohol phosphatidyltransferase family protein [Halomonas sp. EAR18]